MREVSASLLVLHFLTMVVMVVGDQTVISGLLV